MDPIATGGAANLSTEAAKGIFKEAKRHIRYVRIYKRNVEKFEEKLKMLMAKREGVQHEVDAAKRNAEEIKADVENWCDRVDKEIEEGEKNVKELEDKAKNKCFIGLCPNIKCRYQLSRKAEKVTEAFHGLFQQGTFNRVSYRDIPEDNMDGPPKDFEAFKSREKVFNDIMEALKDSTVHMIGVYGMAGVGKTTLVNEIARQAKKEKLFDAVVCGKIKETPDIQEIQNQIADPLGLKFEEQSVTGRARRLCERLKNEKKILVVLDDLWARLDLKEVGIPFGEENKECHILLTSRDRNVLTNEMDAQKIFEIGLLGKKEAWDLFQKMVNNFESPQLRFIATEVAERCEGLPLALVTVGRALRNKDLFAWNDALRRLQRPSATNFKGIPEKVYSAIELSYNNLGSHELKQIFLLCGLFGYHLAIRDVLYYSMGLSLFDGVCTVEETRDRLLTVISDLKASGMLHDSHLTNWVLMHDLIRNAALVIASQDNNNVFNNVFALRREDVLQDWPDRDRLKMFNMISLDNTSISEIPEGLNCPQLTFFHIHMVSKDIKMEVPSKFFMEMKNLKVLDLTKMCFQSLPSSISVLTNLRTLCLDQCVLEDITLIGELKNLEILSFLKSDIKMLPMEIGQLIKVRVLDLSGCTALRIIPPGVLSSLSRLEELFLGDCFVEWEVERHAHQQTTATLAELKLLSRLTTLEIHIPDAKIIPGDLFLEKLKRYKIFIGKAPWDWYESEYSRTLKLKLDRSIHRHLDDGIKMLLKKTEDLYLDEMKGAKVALPGLIDEEDFQHMKNLHIQNCSDIQYIIDDNLAVGSNEFLQFQSLTLQSLPQLISFSYEYQWSSTSGFQHELPLFAAKMVFPCLKNLRLSSINVERIWHDQLSFRTHENLTSLIIEGCGNLKHLLSSSMSKSLVNLECLEIVECKWLREIIFSEEVDIKEEVVLFPQLNSLKIKNLQHLKGFCPEDYEIEFPSLKLLEIENCPAMKGFIHKSMAEENQHFSSQALFDEKVSFPSMEKLIIVHLRNLKIWHNQLSVNSFCKLTEMVVQHCNELATLFPCDMWSTFRRLETLTVSSCGSLEEIFELQSFDMEETHVVATAFRELYIKDLPKLKHVWSKDPQGILKFWNLRVVQVCDCSSLTKNVFPVSVARNVLPLLKDLQIIRCGAEEIVSTEIVSSRFSRTMTKMEEDIPYQGYLAGPLINEISTGQHENLTKLIVEGCGNLEHLFSSSMARSLVNLRYFQIVECKSLREVIISEEKDIEVVIFPQLNSLKLKNLQHLIGFCPEDYNIHFPTLKLLEIEQCPALEGFMYNSRMEDNQRLSPQALFDKKVAFPSLEKLRIVHLRNMKRIWHNQLSVNSFNKLTEVTVEHCNELVSIFPGDMWSAFQKVETLRVSSCGSMEEIFEVQSLSNMEETQAVATGFRELYIKDLPKLKHVWSKDPQGINLTFQHLSVVHVWDCWSLKNMFPASVARDILPQLKDLEIRRCGVEEIVSKEEESETSVTFAFDQLSFLALWDLPNLKWFYPGMHVIKWPMLKKLDVNHYNRVKIFDTAMVDEDDDNHL